MIPKSFHTLLSDEIIQTLDQIVLILLSRIVVSELDPIRLYPNRRVASPGRGVTAIQRKIIQDKR